jgi:prepilin-type N-terminal cleavage/methylation domain-containing protein
VNRNGFTLIELTLVLFVLALSAHLAVRELSRQRVQRLRAAADRQLAEIAEAVCDTDTEGFLSDMGRLPAAVPVDPDDDTSPLSLRELWSRPDGIADHRARPATAANLADGAPEDLADPDLLVPCGWGGPYLRLPPAASRLLDPWGNPLETPDAAGLPRLLDVDLAAVATNGAPVSAVRHYGSDGLDDAERAPGTPDQADATLAFAVPEARLLLTFEPGTLERIHWYAPLGDKITGGICFPEPGSSQLLVEDLTPGIRFLKIYPFDEPPRVLQVTLRPGRDTPLEL